MNDTTDMLTLARERFSARKYTPEPVSDDDLQYILECARLAPSAVNRQPWHLIAVRSEEALAAVRRCYDRPWFATAPMYLIVMRSDAVCWHRPADGKSHGDIDAAILTEHICLAATSRGLGSCWVCNYDTALLATLFPKEGYEAVAIVPIGHVAADCPRPEKRRKAPEEIFEVR